VVQIAVDLAGRGDTVNLGPATGGMRGKPILEYQHPHLAE